MECLVLALDLRCKGRLRGKFRGGFPKNREILIDYAYARIFLLQLRYGAGGTLAEAAAVVEERNQGDLAGEIAADGRRGIMQ